MSNSLKTHGCIRGERRFDMEEDIVENMGRLAERKHEGQFRRGPEKIPYIEHPKAVVRMLAGWGINDDISLAIAWGHDLLEDTDVHEEEIADACGKHGKEVLDGIWELTYDQNRFEKKRYWLTHIAMNCSERIQNIKCADRVCNAWDFASAGKKAKAKLYLEDAQALLEVVSARNEKARKSIEDLKEAIEL